MKKGKKQINQILKKMKNQINSKIKEKIRKSKKVQ